MIQNTVLVLKIFLLVGAIELFFKTKWGDMIGRFFPVPFWVYFLSIVIGTFEVFPKNSPVYSWFSAYGLSTALFLMLVGAPVQELFRMGKKATAAMVIASFSVFAAALASFVILSAWLPSDAPSAVGALLGTWVGGSANMIAVKEILLLPDQTLGALVLVDTVLSYSWMALLFVCVRFQSRFDGDAGKTVEIKQAGPPELPASNRRIKSKLGFTNVILVIGTGFLVAHSAVLAGRVMGTQLTFLTSGAWILLLATLAGTVLAMTPAQKLGEMGSSRVGSFLLYTVLVTIGAKSSLSFAGSVPYYFVLGILIFLIHGILLLSLGKIMRIPLFLLATASQANIGGTISAPIVAEVYRPGTAHMGVLMGIAGALAGTYVGVVGGGLCSWIRRIIFTG